MSKFVIMYGFFDHQNHDHRWLLQNWWQWLLYKVSNFEILIFMISYKFWFFEKLCNSAIQMKIFSNALVIYFKNYIISKKFKNLK